MAINDYLIEIPKEKLKALKKEARVDFVWLSQHFPTKVSTATIRNWINGRTVKTFSFYIEPLIELLEKRIKEVKRGPIAKHGEPPPGVHPLSWDHHVMVACPHEKIAFYFKKAGLSQHKISARTGIEQSKISKWLRRTQKSVDPRDLEQFFKVIEKMEPSVRREWESLSANLPLESSRGSDEKPE